MNKNPDESKNGSELRRRAEELLKVKGTIGGDFAGFEGMSMEVQSLVHELQVHQVELEMQNEELLQAQEQLAAARDRYFDLFDLAPVGYFMLSEDGTIWEANLAGANLLGIHRSQLLGKAFSHFVVEQDQDIFFLCRRKASQTHTRVEDDLRLLRTGGSIFYAHLDLDPTTRHDAQARLIVSDVTQRVLLEQSLVKDKVILSAAERLAFLGGWEWDIEKDEVSLSDELQRIYECEKSSYSFKDFLLLAHPEDRAVKIAALEKALSGDAWFNFEHRILRQKDNVERYIKVSGEVIFDKTGKPLKVYGASQDVTELRENERSLKSHTTRLEALTRDLESFTYVASHDLQAPLRKILKFGELIKTNLPLETDEIVCDYIGRMQKAAARMQSLISDLLNYSQIPNGIRSYKNVNMNHVVQNVLDDLELQIKSSKAQVDVCDLPVLSADPTLMQQLFQNLISNAIKFHEPGKAPVVKIESRYLTPQMVEIQVIDEGIGFDEKHLERIFRPFVRLHGNSTFDGTGIGLSICHKIVERHSGSITAHSKPGKGTTFIIKLPVQQA
ncbi:MAG: PAS domain-containing sensor histidine kinase [Chloroflexi bacterium]|nr:MAG: PAS domain-containing sensor histidine kinase [Chloroflexota bacterium]